MCGPFSDRGISMFLLQCPAFNLHLLGSVYDTLIAVNLVCSAFISGSQFLVSWLHVCTHSEAYACTHVRTRIVYYLHVKT